MIRHVLMISAVPLAMAMIALPCGAQSPDIDAVAAKAVAYLRKTQEENGGWSTKLSPGVTGIVVTGLIKGGKVSPDDPMVAKGL
ncbi:MAG: hypothetical protein KJS91_01015, partial [Planctomycetes bacterium]|nr:hypothetical protein [Planctomycetota bacterium]